MEPISLQGLISVQTVLHLDPTVVRDVPGTLYHKHIALHILRQGHRETLSDVIRVLLQLKNTVKLKANPPCEHLSQHQGQSVGVESVSVTIGITFQKAIATVYQKHLVKLKMNSHPLYSILLTILCKLQSLR